ncbi:MAG: chitin-binding protein [Anaerolinea sp.]|nr:chitin-binding protein [Anaerolinea sp.]
MATYIMAMIPEPGKIEFREMELRDPQPGEVLIKIKTAAICGSDLHLFKGRHPSVTLPSAVGHELAGDVFRIGKEVNGFVEGDRVTVEPVISCGVCHFCQRGAYHLCENISFHYRRGQGAFAEYFYAPQHRTFKLPDSISYEEGTLIEPLSVALHAVKKSGVNIGQSSAVIGGGAIGLLVSMLLNSLTGIKPFLTDINDFRVQKAIELGANGVFAHRGEDLVKKVMEQTNGLGVEHAFEAVGMEATLTQALQSIRKGGKVTLLGIFEEQLPKIPINLFVQREICLCGSQGYVWDFKDSIELVEQGRIKLAELVTTRLHLQQLQQGFDLLCQPGNNQVKVLFNI